MLSNCPTWIQCTSSSLLYPDTSIHMIDGKNESLRNNHMPQGSDIIMLYCINSFDLLAYCHERNKLRWTPALKCSGWNASCSAARVKYWPAITIFIIVFMVTMWASVTYWLPCVSCRYDYSTVIEGVVKPRNVFNQWLGKVLANVRRPEKINILPRWLWPGPCLNIKTVLSTYGDFHVKDKTAVRTSYL